MAGWSGFTDEDLRKIKVTTDKDEGQRSSAQRQAMARRQRQAQQRAVAGKRQTPPREAETTEQLNPSMRLKSQTTKQKEPAANRVLSQELASQNGSSEGGGGDGSVKAEDSSGAKDLEKEVKELDETEAMNVELGNVQKFQQQQKVIEEANKQKRALLAKAIEDRRKRAKAEADKLVRVQQELNHLDTLLTADVGIIRDKIEVASLEYMEAQKRYEKAEKEFIAAKMDLYHKGEAKESLTEHLYTIIHQNEVRKARKLVDLMEKLAMEVTPEEMELTIPAIPQLSNFTAVATLHDPNSPHHPLNLAQNEQQQQQPMVSPDKQQQQQQRNKLPQELNQNKPQQEQQLQQKQSEEGKANGVDESSQISHIPSSVTDDAKQLPPVASVPDTSKHEGEHTVHPAADLSTSHQPIHSTNEVPVSPTTPQPAIPAQTGSSHPVQVQPLSAEQNPEPAHQCSSVSQNNNNDNDSSSSKTTGPSQAGETTNIVSTSKENVENGVVTPAQAAEAADTTPAQQRPDAKGWLNPFS